MAAFDGFPRETIAFLTDLGANNEKAWFEAHRAGYERCFVDPALALVEALAPVAATLTPPHKAEARLNGSLRRIHRDVRFSKDKTPYNPQIHLIFWTGSHPNRSAGIHLVRGPQGLGYGAGHWAFEPDALARYRAALGDPEKRHALEDALRKAAAVGCTLGEPALKTVPKGFDSCAPGAELLRHKGLVARTWGNERLDERLFTPRCAAWCAGIMTALAPLAAWIRPHVETA